jgi:hypothetical protein
LYRLTVPARVGQSPCGIEMSLKKITCRIYLIGLFIFFWLIIRSALPLLTFSLGRWDLLSPKTSEGKQEKNICTVFFKHMCA